MDLHHFYNTVIPIGCIALIMITIIAYISYVTHFSDRFLWFAYRSVKETRDYYRIRYLLIKLVSRDILEKHLSNTVIERIQGAAEKAVPHLREHGKIELQLPNLYQLNNNWKSIKLEVDLKVLRSRNWQNIVP